MRGRSQRWDLNVLTLRKGSERYIYLFDDASRSSLIDVFRDQAADALLEIIRRNRAWNDEAARLQLLKFFEAWGFDDPATTAARRKLSSVLFS